MVLCEPSIIPFTKITLPLGANNHVSNPTIALNKITNPIITISKKASLAIQLFDSKNSVEPSTIFFDEKSPNDAAGAAATSPAGAAGAAASILGDLAISDINIIIYYLYIRYKIFIQCLL